MIWNRKAQGTLRYVKQDPAMPDEAVDVDYMMEHVWIVGDPQEYADKIRQLHEEVGGFGHLLAINQDPDDHTLMQRSLRIRSVPLGGLPSPKIILATARREGNPMPTLHIPPNLDLHYLVDDYTDPWRRPGTILLLHGNAESSAAWYAWVPQLAHRYRLVRPDMRGFGASTPMPRDFPWTLDIIIDDFCRLMDTLGSERFHLVGAKIGGTIARAFAARRPERVRTLTVVGTPPPYRMGAEARVPALIKEFEEQGVEHWARQSMAGRLGSMFPPEGVAWWTTFMGRTAVSTQVGFMKTIACADIRADVPEIACPTLVITTEGSGLASVDETRGWQQTIPDSELLVLPGDSYHVAASHATQCAQATLAFIERRDPAD